MAVPLDISSGHFTQFMTETLDKTHYQDTVILSDPGNFPLPPHSVFPIYLLFEFDIFSLPPIEIQEF